MDELQLPPITPAERVQLDNLRHDLQSSAAAFVDNASVSLSILIHLAICIIHAYDYEAEDAIQLFYPVQGTPARLKAADTSSATAVKQYLSAFVLVSREPLHESIAEAQAVQRGFIIRDILNKRSSLFRQHLKLKEIIEDTRSSTKKRSPTPATNSAEIRSPDSSVGTNVRRRDRNICKISGTLELSESGTRAKPRPDSILQAADIQEFGLVGDVEMSLEVVHGIPWNPRPGFSAMIQSVFGVSVDNSECPENAILLAQHLHSVFARFLISFQWSKEKGNLVMAIRPEKRELALRSLRACYSNVTGEPFHSLEGRCLLPSRPECHVAEPNRTWFDLHRVIGDVFWMTGGAEPRGFTDDEEENVSKILSPDNVRLVMAKMDVFALGQRHQSTPAMAH
ncbi:hypothetical protein C8J56DRAFT_262670 [Mycena floridula]|nr:hypothetical protein C8J56DRAFT_262670 [Mycena floridula]